MCNFVFAAKCGHVFSSERAFGPLVPCLKEVSTQQGSMLSITVTADPEVKSFFWLCAHPVSKEYLKTVTNAGLF